MNKICLLLFTIFLTSCISINLHKLQDKKNNCGQTCVAYITGASVRDVESFLGTDQETTTTQLINALHHFGVKIGEQGYYNGVLPNTALVLIKKPKEYHWLVWKHGRWWDPNFPVTYVYLRQGWEIIYYIEILE